MEEPAPKRLRKSDSVTLNVGGQRFQTSLATLGSDPDSFFGALASGRHRVDWEQDGSLFIDRSPKHFPFVLEYLRNGRSTPLQFESTLHMDELRLEAEFYGLTHLAAQCRRFKLHDKWLMTELQSSSGNVCALHGRRRAAAMFDIVDPDDFEVTVSGRNRNQSSGDDWSSLFHSLNVPGVLIGVVPLEADLSEEWQACANPLPVSAPGPFHAGFVSWHRRDEMLPWVQQPPQNPEAASERWPRHVLLPPAFKEGVAVLLTTCLFRDPTESYQADAFLMQVTPKHSTTISRWWGRPPSRVSMRFKRSPKTCTLEVAVCDEDGQVEVVKGDLHADGLDCTKPYRPVVFFGGKQTVDIEDDYIELA
eukprot:TRINITY_DN9549_c1_g2_i1.p1 TRINITY_DN9549_c1_g2~~TRINITY_DN9549_c1_g2_i1.p1  ORF type:complete len:363 (-),score=38.32 TRINITY_DN9549_c1_g2_i1:166-1254(-)